MKPWLFVGAKVMFAGGGTKGSAKNPHELVRGEVYTIRGFYTTIRGTLGLYVEERPPVKFYQGVEIGWAADNFRPVSTTDTTQTVAAMRELMQKARDEKRVTVSA